MTYKDISNSRAKIMGVAIIWILLYHMEGRFLIHSYFPGFLAEVCAFIFGLGSTGVELFLMCSGFGLCFSIRKNPNKLIFYSNRLKRIVPEYTIGLILLQIMENKSAGIFFLELFTLSFYFKLSCHYWYITAIVLLYLIFPLIYKLLADLDEKTFKMRAILLIGGSYLITFALHFIIPYYEAQLCTVFDKIPVFIIGVVVGMRYDPEKKVAGKKGLVIAAIAFEASLIAYLAYMFTYAQNAKYTLKGFIVVPMSVAITFLLICVFKKVNLKHSLLALCGKISLSLYIADGVYATFSERAASYGMPYLDNALASIPFIVILAVMIHFTSELIRKGIKKVNLSKKNSPA